MRRAEAVIGGGQIAAFLGGWVVFFICLQVGMVVAWLATLENGFTMQALTQIGTESPPTWLILGTLVVQFSGMLGLSAIVLGAGQLVRRFWLGTTERPWVKGFALQSGSANTLAWTAAIAGGLTVGWLPGFVAQWLRATFPALDLGALAIVGEIIETGSTAEIVALGVLIAIVAPVVEELVFRGVLWSALDRWLPTPAVIAITSILFAGFHMDPTQAIPLLLTGTFFGFVRWTTGSVKPAIAVHVVNNSLALGLGILGLEAATSFVVTASAIITVAMCWVLWQSRPATSPRLAAAA